MLIAFWLLLFLYVGLAVLFFVTNAEKSDVVSPWPVLKISPEEESSRSACQSQDDCPSTHVCLGGECVPKLLRGGHDCDPETGQWISHDYGGVTFAVCVCSQPDLMNQKFFGGNCDVNVGCGVHGLYVRERNVCECDPGYRAVGLTCQKLSAIDHANLSPCGPDEIHVPRIKSTDGFFHADYIKSLSGLKCVKRPCSSDALSGRPLKHARFEKDWGCICDPRYGLFGVHLESPDKKYLNTPGFDACAGIFEEEPTDPVDVKLITYFYLGNREPLSFILFEKLEGENLVNPFEGSKQLILSQKSWRHDYAQHFFRTNESFRARTRHVSSFFLFNIERVNEWLYVNDFRPVPCRDVPKFWEDRLNTRVDVYNILYKSPVCSVGMNEPEANPMFWDRVIVNPLHVTFKDYDHLHRFNAFVLHYDPEMGSSRWSLDLDQEYNTTDYLHVETNAPKYEVVANKKPDISTLMIEGQM